MVVCNECILCDSHGTHPCDSFPVIRLCMNTAGVVCSEIYLVSVFPLSQAQMCLSM